MIEKRSVDSLAPHPMNQKIYGSDNFQDNDLKVSISQNGLLEPLVITNENVVVSGHRRLKVVKELGWDLVDCRVEDFTNPLLSLILFNKSRIKTSRELLNESEIIQKEYSKHSYQGKRNDLNGGGKNHTINNVANGLGISVSHLKRLRKINNEAPHLFEFIDKGEISVSTAVDMIKSRTQFKRLRGMTTPANIRHFEDYYPTHPKYTQPILDLEKFSGSVWEPACGEGHMSEVLKQNGLDVFSSDLIDRGYGIGHVDFTNDDHIKQYGKFDNVITNPPFDNILPFILQAKKVARKKIAIIGKTQLLEGVARYNMWMDKDFPLKTMYQFSGRVAFIKNKLPNRTNSMIGFAWYVFEKGYKGKPTIEWIQP
tara:strand:- start:330 stop:1436 length:1107 start_codon:yes stop_codon:yes gene_type:complete